LIERGYRDGNLVTQIFLILPNPNLENIWRMAGSIAFLHEMRLACANLLVPLRNKCDLMFLSHPSINILFWLNNGCLWFLRNRYSILTNMVFVIGRSGSQSRFWFHAGSTMWHCTIGWTAEFGTRH
jgi:hypothetical protein